MELTGKNHQRQEDDKLPDGWELVRVGDHFDFKNGLNKAKEFFGYGTPIANYMDVFQKVGLTGQDINGKVSVTKDEINNYGIRKGDVLFTRTSETVDEIGLSSTILEDVKDGVFSGFVLRARPKTDKFSPEYSQYCFRTSHVRKQITATSSYTTRALTNGRLLSAIKVNLPSEREEQVAIATALSDADALIAGLEKLIEKKRLIKQGAMQELLRPNKGWQVKTIEELSERIVGGGTPSRANPDFWNGELPWVTVKDFNSYNPYATQEYITKAGLTNSATNLIPKGTLIVCTRIALGKAVRYKVDACINQDLKALFLRDNVDAEFLNYWFELNASTIQEMGGGSTVMGVSLPDLKRLPIAIPSISEQRRVALILSDIDNEIWAVERKLIKQKAIKQGIMQVLLTGKVRLVATHETKRTIELTPEPTKQNTGHNIQFNEAVLISVLTERYGSVKYPLGRFRYTKFLYLFHRYVEGAANGFLKKAAGPYNPSNRYGGPEGIAIKNKYVQAEGKGFVACDNIGEAKRYFDNWYHDDALAWLDKFRFYKNDQLELLTTVDMAVDDLRKEDKNVSVASVKAVIAGNKEWKPKLEKDFFNDAAIARAIQESMQLFPS